LTQNNYQILFQAVCALYNQSQSNFPLQQIQVTAALTDPSQCSPNSQGLVVCNSNKGATTQINEIVAVETLISSTTGFISKYKTDISN